MENHVRPCSPGRLLFAAAALLYLVGTVADPLVHAFAGAEQDAAPTSIIGGGESNDGDRPPIPLGDVECALCHLLRPIALNEPALQVPEPLDFTPERFSRDGYVHASSAPSPALARAPPLA
jgi:hypothetical protein